MAALILSAPLTHGDWMLKTPGPAWGPDGVRYMLARCKAFGFEKIFWRCYDAGRSTYFSELIEPYRHADHDEVYQYSPGYIPMPDAEMLARYALLDYTTLDTLRAAVEIGHELGLEIYGWLSINEDDHGFGWPSRFAREHPEYRWVRRNGEPYHSQLSFAFPAVRDYKLGLVREVLAYDVDGLLLDWIRTGDIRDNPQADEDGIADFGYETPNLEAFRQAHGRDPRDVPPGDTRWIATCAAPITAFMREVRALAARRGRPTGLSAMVQHPWAYRGILPEQVAPDTPQWVVNMRGNRYAGALPGLYCDIAAWAREGLVDTLLASGYYVRGGTPEMAWRYLHEETEGRLPLTCYAWVPGTAADAERDLDRARRLGAGELLFWEADYIDNAPAEAFAAIAATMARSRGAR